MHGAASLSDAELLAVLLGTGSSAESVHVLAARVLEWAGGVRALAELHATELEAQTGIGQGKAGRLLAAIELGARACSRPLHRQCAITSSRDVYTALRVRVRAEAREHFFAIALDAKNRPVAEIEVAVGGLASCCVSPSDVFRPVLRAAAVGVIFAHNHPSGEASPSEQDVDVTQRLCQAGQLLGVQVLDHLILGESGYFSFLDNGLLQCVTPWGVGPPGP